MTSSASCERNPRISSKKFRTVNQEKPCPPPPAAIAVAGSVATARSPSTHLLIAATPSISNRSRRLPERPGQRLEQDPQEERRQAEQKSQDVEPPGPDDQENDPDQPEELQDVLDDEPLVHRLFARERLLQDLPDEEEVPVGDCGAARRAGQHRGAHRAGGPRRRDSSEDQGGGEEDLPLHRPER